MKAGCLALLVVFLFPLSSCAYYEPSPERTPKQTPATQAALMLTIVYDNNDYDQRLETRWGFSCFIKGLEKNVLFDTGADSPTLLSNMEKLDIDPADVDVVVLSHIHGDHVGGLDGFLKENSDVTVYLPESFPSSFKDNVSSSGAEVNEVSKAKKVFGGVYTTGELGSGIKEQSLVVTTEKGMVIVTGCAHPGVVNIVDKARDIVPEEPVCLVVGGFHMSSASRAQIQSVIEGFRDLGVMNVAPCHCSGDETRRLFKQEYGENYIESGVGKRIGVPCER
ncbi:MAG: MBL fold metallo-hydrolase [Dehalococcoidia bacterium]